MFRQTLKDTKFVQLPYSKQIESTLINYGPGEVRLHKDLPATYSNSIPVRMNSQFFMPKDTVYFCSSTNPPSEIVVAEGYQQFNPIQLAPMKTGLIPSTSFNPPETEPAVAPSILQDIPIEGGIYFINNFLTPSPLNYPFNQFFISSGGQSVSSGTNNILLIDTSMFSQGELTTSIFVPLCYISTMDAYAIPELTTTLLIPSVSNGILIANGTGVALTDVEFGIYSNAIQLESSRTGLLLALNDVGSIAPGYEVGTTSQIIKRATFDVLINGDPGLEYYIQGSINISYPSVAVQTGTLEGDGRPIASGTIPSSSQVALYGLQCGLEPLGIIISNPTTSTLTFGSLEVYDLGV